MCKAAIPAVFLLVATLASGASSAQDSSLDPIVIEKITGLKVTHVPTRSIRSIASHSNRASK